MNKMSDRWELRVLSGLFGVVVISIGSIYGQNSSAKGQIISSFESPADLQRLKLTNARVSLTSEHVTDGKTALEVDFIRPGTASIELLSETSPWDWRSFGAIAVDIYNPADQEVWIGIELNDAAPTGGLSRYVGGRGNVTAHDAVSYYYPLGASSSLEHGMRGGPPHGSGNNPGQ
jgi:hypothetical protein